MKVECQGIVQHFFMDLPGAVIFVNADLNALLKEILTTQLRIHESMTDVEFDARILLDGHYADTVRNSNSRILVIRSTFQDFTNRNLADIVIFVSSGQATIEKNNFGPPGLSLPVYRLSIFDLLRGSGKIK